MTSTVRRLALLLAFAMGLSLVVAPAVAAHSTSADLPTRIDLPNGWQPEGITSWGKWLFAGSLKDGAIYRANAKNGMGRIFVAGEAGKAATGLHIDRWGRLWAAGAGTGEVRVFDARNGKLLQTYTFGPGPMFLNDLDIARNRVVVTDSMNARVGVIPLGEHGALPDPSKAFFMPLTGDFQVQMGFNANGIAARGGWLVIVQSNTGFLFRLNPRTGDTKKIDTGGYLVNNGTASTSAVGPCTSSETRTTSSPCCVSASSCATPDSRARSSRRPARSTCRRRRPSPSAGSTS